MMRLKVWRRNVSLTQSIRMKSEFFPTKMDANPTKEDISVVSLHEWKAVDWKFLCESSLWYKWVNYVYLLVK